MKVFHRILFLTIGTWTALSTSAVVEIVSPSNGEIVPLLNELQKSVAATPSPDVRERYLAGYKTGALKKVASAQNEFLEGKEDCVWRQSLPVSFVWRTTKGERGPWTLSVATKADFSDGHAVMVPAESAGFVWTNANLMAGVAYRWRVTAAGGECAEADFRTEDALPRLIGIEGRVANIRDLGGYRTDDGRRVRQGLVYRGQGLNDNSMDGKKQGKLRLTSADRDYLTKTLGIRTDLDLRSRRETAGMTASPMGASVRFINRASPDYAAIFKPSGMKTMADNFRVFCNRENYPIYFHCIAGASRTGSLAYVLNGLLGVPKRQIEIDWEFTYYPDVPDGEKERRGLRHFDVGFGAYGQPGDSLSKRIELYLLDCGVTEKEIASFRSVMLEQRN